MARISPIPKVDNPRENNDFRPISILPVMSKIYEKLVLRQMATYLSNNAILEPNISAYRKGHSTTTAMLAMRDDIIAAINKGEITIAVMADFSKPFDTVAYETVLQKLHQFGFSKHALKWFASYLSERKQFVQIDDRKSSELEVTFGVSQWSILGPVLFNHYVNDLAKNLPTAVKAHQYADDTRSMPTANRPPSTSAMSRYRRLLTSSVVGPRIATSFLILPKLEPSSSAPNRCPAFTNLSP